MKNNFGAVQSRISQCKMKTAHREICRLFLFDFGAVIQVDTARLTKKSAAD
jgi:hypothetical protein